jgi:hypothetical protein
LILDSIVLLIDGRIYCCRLDGLCCMSQKC